jgi:hypothetical protein
MLAAFGFFMAVGYDAPWYVWLIGFLCYCADDNEKKALRKE